MRPLLRSALAAGGAALLVGAAAAGARAQGCGTQRASVATGGAEAGGASRRAALSADGRYVAFVSAAADLVPGDANGVEDVFVRDLVAGTTERVSVASDGTEGDGPATACALSADGRYVAFVSLAANLAPGDAAGWEDVFRHDRLTGETVRASLTPLGLEPDGACLDPAISADGAVIAYRSFAANLAPGDVNGTSDVFLRDLGAGVTELVSATPAGTPGDGPCEAPALSADGLLVAFHGLSADLVPGDLNTNFDVFVRDRTTGQTARASLDAAGAELAGSSFLGALSADGTTVAFWTDDAGVVPGDGNGWADVFVRDLASGAVERASVATGGAEASGASFARALSADGRHVLFASQAEDLVAGDTNAALDLFRRDRVTRSTRRVSVGHLGQQAAAACDGAALSADGGTVAFESAAANLVAADANQAADVFASACPTPPIAAYCFGDGLGATCPCGNAAPGAAGCANSTGQGAALVGLGTGSLARADTGLAVAGAVPLQPALFFQGLNAPGGGAGIPFGDGLRCAGGGVVRLLTVALDGAGAAATGPGLALLGGLSAPALRRYQCWYRDPQGGPCGAGFNLSNGVAIDWLP